MVVKELRASVSGGAPGDVITAANPASLIEHLRENHKSVDPEYTEVEYYKWRIISVCFYVGLEFVLEGYMYWEYWWIYRVWCPEI